MTPARLHVIGGFLGAGKTTLIAQTVRALRDRAPEVGVVTNDQAEGLVDTATIARAGAPTEEVAGSCYCCDFDSLERSVSSLRERGARLILAEAVGSCTDLAATVLRPMRALGSAEVQIAPLTVVVDPRRLQRIVFDRRRRRLHPSTVYIYEKQIEEAEVLVLNKVDSVDESTRADLVAELRARYAPERVLSMSATAGVGMDAWLAYVTSDAAARPRSIELDYARYAEGEAVLGWLNARARVTRDPGQRWSALASSLLGQLDQRLRALGAEVAHAKLAIEAGGGAVRAHLTETRGVVDVSHDSARGSQGALILNVRAQTSPEHLRAVALECLSGAALEEIACFSPSAPVPTHRLEASALAPVCAQPSS